MKVFLLTVLLVSIAMQNAGAQTADNSRCDPSPDVPVNIVPVYENPIYDYDVTLAELQDLSRDTVHIIPEALTLGLTRYKPELNVRVPNTTRDMPGGNTCVKINRVEVTFGYKEVTVYVAKELASDTCGFKQVLEHEMKHVEVQKKILNHFIPILQQNLKQYLAENGAQQGQDFVKVVNWMHENVQDIAQNTVEDIYSENVRLQAEIDTVEEYTRVGNSCGTQFRDVVRAYIRNGQQGSLPVDQQGLPPAE